MGDLERIAGMWAGIVAGVRSQDPEHRDAAKDAAVLETLETVRAGGLGRAPDPIEPDEVADLALESMARSDAPLTRAQLAAVRAWVHAVETVETTDAGALQTILTYAARARRRARDGAQRMHAAAEELLRAAEDRWGWRAGIPQSFEALRRAVIAATRRWNLASARIRRHRWRTVGGKGGGASL